MVNYTDLFHVVCLHIPFPQLHGTGKRAREGMAAAPMRHTKRIGAPPDNEMVPFKARRKAYFTAYDGYKAGLIWFPTRKPAPSTVAHVCVRPQGARGLKIGVTGNVKAGK